MKSTSILRQVKDIQTQADRLINASANMPEIESFAVYNDEIKAYLLTHIKDEFVLNYIRTIPTLNIDAIEVKSGLKTLVMGLIFGGGSTVYHEKQKIEVALEQIKEIYHKYSSYEMMIRNNL